MSTTVAKKSDGGSIGRRQSMMPDAARKQSVLPPDINKQTIDPAHAVQRRPSIMDPNNLRRPSQDRKQSIVESMAGRSTLIMTSAHTQRPNVRYENTYKTEPDVKFKGNKVKDAIKDIFEKELSGITYDKEKCLGMSKTLADRIKQSVKLMGFMRYKIVVFVAIGQQQDSHPSVAFTSRSIWNPAFDNFSEYTYENPSLYAVGLVYALYAE